MKTESIIKMVEKMQERNIGEEKAYENFKIYKEENKKKRLVYKVYYKIKKTYARKMKK